MSMFTKQDGEAGLVNDVIIGGVLSSSTVGFLIGLGSNKPFKGAVIGAVAAPIILASSVFLGLKFKKMDDEIYDGRKIVTQSEIAINPIK